MDELLIKYVLGETKAEESRRVEAWIAESGRRFEEFRRVHGLGRKTASPVGEDTQEALARLRERCLTAGPTETMKASMPAPVRRFSIGRVAAVVGGLFVIGMSTWVVLH